jgi:hypothetical protein
LTFKDLEDRRIVVIWLTSAQPGSDSKSGISADTPDARRLYNLLTEEFLSELRSPKELVDVTEAMYAFLRLFLRGTWRDASPIPPLFQEELKNAWKTPNPINLFRCFVILFSHKPGADLLQQHDPLLRQDPVKELVNEWRSHSSDLAIILREFSLDHEVRNQVVPLYERLLRDADDDVHRLTIEDLRDKRQKMAKSELKPVFVEIILDHLDSITEGHEISFREKRTLRLIAEFCVDEPEIRRSMLSKPVSVDELSKSAPFIFVSLIPDLVGKSGFKDIVSRHIQWWTTIGITQYVSLYDQAVEAALTEQFTDSGIADKLWQIVDLDGLGIVPPHLFRELFLNQEALRFEEVNGLVENVAACLDRPSSTFDELRAAFLALGHFASVPQNAPKVLELNLLDRMLAAEKRSSSFVLRGTLIAALSLFDCTSQFEVELEMRGWRIVHFGPHQHAVVPAVFPPPKEFKEDFISDPVEIPPGDQFTPIVDSLRYLLNPNVCRQKEPPPCVLQFRSREDPAFKVPAMAKYAHEMLARFPYQADARMLITGAFAGVPVLEVPE